MGDGQGEAALPSQNLCPRGETGHTLSTQQLPEMCANVVRCMKKEVERVSCLGGSKTGCMGQEARSRRFV